MSGVEMFEFVLKLLNFKLQAHHNCYFANWSSCLGLFVLQWLFFFHIGLSFFFKSHSFDVYLVIFIIIIIMM